MSSALRSISRVVVSLIVSLGLCATPSMASAQSSPTRSDYVLGAGDIIRFSVFQNADLSVEARIGESGTITYPLVGAIRIAGLTSAQAESLVAKRLKDGNFLQNPSVTATISQFRSQQVSVLGNVNRPGRYPLETTGAKLSEMLAQAGGVAVGGSDLVVINSENQGKRVKIEVDVAEMFLTGNFDKDIQLQAGDIIYVQRQTQFYIHGQVQRPGTYPIERGMTIGQAIARSGGLTLRGKEKGMRLTRMSPTGLPSTFEPKLDEIIKTDDLLFIPESLF